VLFLEDCNVIMACDFGKMTDPVSMLNVSAQFTWKISFEQIRSVK